MNILNLSQTNYHIKFKSSIPEYEDDGVLGYSDTYSQFRREKFRRDDYPYTIPENDPFLYGGRLKEEELEAMLNYLAPKIKVIDKESILKIPTIRKAMRTRKGVKEQNIYTGETLYDCPDWIFETVKNAGVETVIDLASFGASYKEQVERAGLKFYSYPISDIYNKPGFKISKTYKKNKLVEFIKEMQKDNVYIACSSGTTKTYVALTLNDIFNPQAAFTGSKLPDDYITRSARSDAKKFAQEIYPYMTEEDKISMGWTPEFEERVKEKLSDNIFNY